jgi:hypothetical protein
MVLLGIVPVGDDVFVLEKTGRRPGAAHEETAAGVKLVAGARW